METALRIHTREQGEIELAEAGTRRFVALSPRWEPTGPEQGTGRLSCPTVIIVCGVPLHVEALAVDTVDGVQQAADDTWEGDFDALVSLYEGRFQTFTHEGRTYVPYAVPFSD